MAHLKGFGLENFRVFKEHTWFDFAPITLLIGPNSSGKSSLIKALLLLKEAHINLSQRENYTYKPYRTHSLSFENQQINVMGLENIIHNEKKDGISFSLSLDDFVFNQKLLLQIEFSSKDKYFYKLLFQDGEILLKLDWINTLYFDIELFFQRLKKENSFDLENMKIKIENNELSQTQVRALSYFLTFDKKLYEYQINNYEKEVNIFEKGNLTPEGLKKMEGVEDEDEKQILTMEIFCNECIEKEGLGRFEKHLEYNSMPIEFAEHFYALINLGSINKMIQNIKEKINYLPSIKGFQRRSFRTNEDDILNQVIKNLPKSDGKDEFLRKWEEKFKLDGKINWQTDTKLGIRYLDLNEKSLVDLGFGISQLVAILLSIYKYSKGKNDKISLGDLFGSFHNKFNQIMIFEEPESNLHPAFQSKLANLFCVSMQDFQIQYIIETHSEYMVRKFQYLVAKGEMKKEDIVIYYFHDPNNVPEGEKQVKKIEILEDGSLSDDFGSGFFDEAANWELELLRLKKNKIRQN